MRQLGIADLLAVFGVTVVLWLVRYLLPDLAHHPEALGRDAQRLWNLPRRPLFWVLVGLMALLGVAIATAA
jgi:hypothetical protein